VRRWILGALGSSPGGSFLTPEITCFDRFGQVGSENVRLAALDLKGISVMDLGGSELDPGIPGIPCFFT